MKEFLINLDKVAKIEIRREKIVKYRAASGSIFSHFFESIEIEDHKDAKIYGYDDFCLWLRNKQDFTEFPTREEFWENTEVIRRPSITFIAESGFVLGRKYFMSDKELDRAIQKIGKSGQNLVHLSNSL